MWPEDLKKNLVLGCFGTVAYPGFDIYAAEALPKAWNIESSRRVVTNERLPVLSLAGLFGWVVRCDSRGRLQMFATRLHFCLHMFALSLFLCGYCLKFEVQCCLLPNSWTRVKVRRELQRVLLGSKKCGAQHRICIAVIWVCHGTIMTKQHLYNPHEFTRNMNPLSWWTIMISGIKGSFVNIWAVVPKNCLAILGQELEIQIQERRQEQQLPRCGRRWIRQFWGFKCRIVDQSSDQNAIEF